MNWSDSEHIRESAKEFSFYAFRIKQPIGDFYSAVLSSKRLVEICYFDIRGLSKKDDFADFMGIQRELDPSRVKEIKTYVQTLDPSFPTAIVLAVDDRCAVVEEPKLTKADDSEGCALVKLTLRNHPEPTGEGVDPILFREIARIIDGQHRIAGLIGYDGPQFDLNVSIFVGADIATQASIFSTVNLAQTKVNKSLVYDLFSYAQTRSPEKTCHEIAVVLDKEPSSPFYRRIKRLGVATEGRFGETLSQATFVKGLIGYISRDVVADRDAAKRGRAFPKVEDRHAEQLILREFFTSNQDDVIADLLWNYFDAVREKWPEAWSKTGQGWVLNKTAGYSGLMRFFKPCYLGLKKRKSSITKTEFLSVFQPMKITDNNFRSENIRPGTSGEKYVYELLLEHSMFA
jgi:DGQHR domain-containing protein